MAIVPCSCYPDALNCVGLSRVTRISGRRSYRPPIVLGSLPMPIAMPIILAYRNLKSSQVKSSSLLFQCDNRTPLQKYKDTHKTLCLRTMTRKLCYRKDDRAMHHIHGCPENFRDSPTTPTATIPNSFHGLLFGSTL